jgi:hypothetical protein
LSYSLNNKVAECDYLRARSADVAHVEKLRARSELLILGNIAVDIPNLIERRFACDTRHCVRITKRNGRRWFGNSCCTDLVVEIAAPERERLEQLARDYRRRVRRGPKALRKIAEKVLDGDAFAETVRDEPILNDRRTNRCIMSYLDGGKVLRCSINTMVDALDYRIEDFKPDPCFMYPIHYVDYEPDQWFLTVVNRENYKALDAAKEAATMPCLNRPIRTAPPAYISLRRELEHLWGKAFWRELDQAARRLLADAPRP